MLAENSAPQLSIIIPVWNDADELAKCLESIPLNDNLEVIVVDGGSDDESLAVAQRFLARTITSERGRAQQMNAGAKLAQGEVMLFLHADSQCPAGADSTMLGTINEGYVAGCFAREFRSPSRLLKLTCRWATWRARRYFVVLGDQGMFVRRDVFESLGGFREMEIFEDLDLSLRIKRCGKWKVLDEPLLTSARRFEGTPLLRIIKDGVLLAWGWLQALSSGKSDKIRSA